MNAIIYTTNSGSTERYARLLSRETGLPAYSLAEAKNAVPAGAEVIYLGWIMAGTVKGYAAAARSYTVRAVCGVGMVRPVRRPPRYAGKRPSAQTSRSSPCRAILT